MNPFDKLRETIAAMPDDPNTGTGWREQPFEQTMNTPNETKMNTENKWPEPIATKDRPPTKEDANESGYVQVWDGEVWVPCEWFRVLNCVHWMHQPPAPKSAEDAAFEKWINERHDKGIVYIAALAAFRLGIAFAKGAK